MKGPLRLVSYKRALNWRRKQQGTNKTKANHSQILPNSNVAPLCKDVLANTENSVDGLDVLEDETFLCPSEVGYIRPLRAINSEGLLCAPDRGI